MKRNSWRHHYLPVFYLNGFTDQSKKFKIYDVEKGRFIKNGKDFPPSSYFFEKNLNTVTEKNDNVAPDFLETKFYSPKDDKISKLFSLINSSDSDNRFSISEQHMPILQNFVNLMYWRLPHRANEIEQVLKKEGLRNLGITVQNIDGTENANTLKAMDKLREDPDFKKGLHYWMSIIDTVKMVECRTPLTIQPFIEGLPLMCSDNPVLFEKENSPNVFSDDFIFPLSGNKLFIRAKRTKKFNLKFKFMVDILTFKQAIKYACFTDERYVDSINEFYEKHFKSTLELRTGIFEYLKNDT